MSIENQPDYAKENEVLWGLRKPNWEEWKPKKLARLWQAVSLACNLDPSNFQLFNAPQLSRLMKQPPQQFEDLLVLAKGAIGASKILRLLSKSPEGLDESEVDFSNFRKWAKSVQVDLPEEFPGNSLSKQAPLEETAVGERERATLLTLIAALANGMKIDISAHSKAAVMIEALTSEIGARIAARTIEEHLKRIPAALEKRSS